MAGMKDYYHDEIIAQEDAVRMKTMKLLNTLRKIRACEFEATAQLVFEAYIAKKDREVKQFQDALEEILTVDEGSPVKTYQRMECIARNALAMKGGVCLGQTHCAKASQSLTDEEDSLKNSKVDFANWQDEVRLRELLAQRTMNQNHKAAAAQSNLISIDSMFLQNVPRDKYEMLVDLAIEALRSRLAYGRKNDETTRNR